MYKTRDKEPPYSPYISTRDSRISELEIKLQLLIEENQRLNVTINQCIQDGEIWKTKYHAIEQDLYVLHEAQNKMPLLINEVEKLNNLLAEKTKENQILRTKYDELTQDENKNHTQLPHFLNENLKESNIWKPKYYQSTSESIVDLAIIGELRLENSELMIEKKNLMNMVEDKIKELEDLKRKYTKDEDELDIVKKQVEIESEKVKEKIEEIESLKEIINQNTNTITDQNTRLLASLADNDRLSNEILGKNIEIQAFNSKLQTEIEISNQQNQSLIQENMKLQAKMINHDEQIKDFDEKLKQMYNDYERLNGILMETRTERDNLCTKLHEIEHLPTENSNLKLKLSHYTSQHEKMSGVMNQKHKELDDLQNKLNENEKIIASLDLQIKEALEERDKSNKKLDEVKKDLEIWKKNFLDIENLPLKCKEFEEKVEFLKEENKQLKQELTSQGIELRQAREAITQMEYEIMKIPELKSSLGNASKEIEAIGLSLDQKTKEIENLRVKENELYRVNELILDLQTQIRKIQTEKNTLDCLVMEKTRDFDLLTQKYEKSQGIISDFHQRNERQIEENHKLNEIIQENLKDLDIWKAKYLEMEHKISNYNEIQNKLMILQIENDRINRIIEDKTRENDNWKMRCYNMEKTILNYKDLECKFGEKVKDKLNNEEKEEEEEGRHGLNGRSSKIQANSSELNQLEDSPLKIRDLHEDIIPQGLPHREIMHMKRNAANTTLDTHHKEVENPNLFNSALECKFHNLQLEYDKLALEYQEKATQVHELSIKIRDSEANNTELTAQNEQLGQKLKSSESCIKEKIKQIEDLKLKYKELLTTQELNDHIKNNIIALQHDNQRLRGILDENITHVENLKLKLKDYDNDRVKLMKDNENLREEKENIVRLFSEKVKEIDYLQGKSQSNGNPLPPNGQYISMPMVRLFQETRKPDPIIGYKDTERNDLNRSFKAEHASWV